MGTRHLTMVVLDGQTRVAQYGQWDGYPDGQGRTVLDFLAHMDRQLLEQKVRASRFITDEEYNEAWKKTGATGDWATQEQADKFNAQFPALSRDHGADILQFICAHPDGVVLKDSSSFGLESLFCEWAYVIDLDKNVLEFYRGFNTDPAADVGRFAALKAAGYEPHKSYDGKCEYQPVQLVKVYPFDALPTVDQLGEDGKTAEDREEEAKEAAEEAAAQEAAATPQSTEPDPVPQATAPAEPVPAECGTTPATNQ